MQPDKVDEVRVRVLYHVAYVHGALQCSLGITGAVAKLCILHQMLSISPWSRYPLEVEE